MDIWSPEKRSAVMARVRGRDTKPELIVRSMLHRVGFRFSLRRKDLPGKPDIVLAKYRTVIFVHGCFWHRHRGCRQASNPKSRVEYWREKFERNVARDLCNRKALEALGWQVLVVWECEVLKNPLAVIEQLVKRLAPEQSPFSYESLPDRRTLLNVAEAHLQWNLARRESRDPER